MVFDHPFGENRAAAADDAGYAVFGERNVLDENASMDCHIIHTLLGLLFDDFEQDVDVEIFNAADAVQGFVDGHGADGHGRSINDGLADFRNVAAGGKIHDGVCAIFNGVLQLGEFFINVGGGGGIADVGVDFAFGLNADAMGSRLA